ncbi:MAG: pantoate--beta-alanine ligase [Desulfococcaceae bacterium]|nr:pantoate--beta-alanine ligase [Desulfococcaceae bacterium]
MSWPFIKKSPSGKGGAIINIINNIREMQIFSDRSRKMGRRIAFVPTMGFLHKGHASLIREAARHGDDVVLSIFVNPTQFAPGEDLEAYPRDFDGDRKVAEKAGANVIYFPDVKEMYGKNYQTFVELEKIPAHLCGLSRPVHFRGVATVVTKLFNIVKPHTAVFGQKDYQQLLLIRQMVRDLNFDIEIIGGPIVREPDGLAMSSRNTYLSPAHRRQALCLYQSLQKAGEMVSTGVRDAAEISAAAKAIIKTCPDAQIDYIALCNPETLENISDIKGQVLMALAVKIGNTRLIDNMLLNTESGT